MDNYDDFTDVDFGGQQLIHEDAAIYPIHIYGPGDSFGLGQTHGHGGVTVTVTNPLDSSFTHMFKTINYGAGHAGYAPPLIDHDPKAHHTQFLEVASDDEMEDSPAAQAMANSNRSVLEPFHYFDDNELFDITHLTLTSPVAGGTNPQGGGYLGPGPRAHMDRHMPPPPPLLAGMMPGPGQPLDHTGWMLPPPLPLRQGPNSCMVMPLLIPTSGMGGGVAPSPAVRGTSGRRRSGARQPLSPDSGSGRNRNQRPQHLQSEFFGEGAGAVAGGRGGGGSATTPKTKGQAQAQAQALMASPTATNPRKRAVLIRSHSAPRAMTADLDSTPRAGGRGRGAKKNGLKSPRTAADAKKPEDTDVTAAVLQPAPEAIQAVTPRTAAAAAAAVAVKENDSEAKPKPKPKPKPRRAATVGADAEAEAGAGAGMGTPKAGGMPGARLAAGRGQVAEADTVQRVVGEAERFRPEDVTNPLNGTEAVFASTFQAMLKVTVGLPAGDDDDRDPVEVQDVVNKWMPKTSLAHRLIEEHIEFSQVMGFSEPDLRIIHTVLRRRDVKNPPPSADPSQKFVFWMWQMHLKLLQQGEGTANASGVARAVCTAVDLEGKVARTLREAYQGMACKVWIRLHYMHPYITTADKRLLAAYVGVSDRQITDFLTNWRARHWRKEIRGEVGPAEPEGRLQGAGEGAGAAGKSDAKAAAKPKKSVGATSGARKSGGTVTGVGVVNCAGTEVPLPTEAAATAGAIEIPIGSPRRSGRVRRTLRSGGRTYETEEEEDDAYESFSDSDEDSEEEDSEEEEDRPQQRRRTQGRRNA